LPAKKGQALAFYVENNSGVYEKVGLTQSKEITYSKDTLDTTTDTDVNPDWASYLGGRKEGEFTAEALYDWDKVGFGILYDVQHGDTSRPMKLEGDAGELQVKFDGHVTELSRTLDTNELAVYSVSVTLEGKPEEGTV
jgi:predicted secreted protein